MKKNRKFISILLTLAMLATMLVPMAAPAAAASGLTVNYVNKVVNVSDDNDTGDFGSIIIKEADDFPEAISADGVEITLTLVEGVEFPNDADYFDAMYDTDCDVVVESYTATSATFTVSGTDDEAIDKVTFNFEDLEIDSDFSGDVKVLIDAMDDSVTSGEYVIGRVLGDDNTVTALSKKDIVVGDKGVATGTARITESSQGSMSEGEITVTLPDDVTFAENDDDNYFTVGGTLQDLVLTDLDDADAINDDGDELCIELDENTHDKRGFLDLTFSVKVAYDAEPGDLEVEIEGDSDNNIPDTTVVLGTIKDFGTGVSIKSVKEFNAGQWGKELDDIKIKENAEGSLTPSRYIVAEITGAKFAYSDEADVPCDGDMECTDASDKKLVWKISDDPDKEYTLKKVKIGSSIGSSGDVTIKWSGNAGLSGDLVVAKIVAPVTATVENATEVKIGVQNQAVGDIIVKENKAGVIQEEQDLADADKDNMENDGTDDTTTLTLKCPDGVDFAGRPTATVTEGDLKLDNNNLVYLGDDDKDGLYDNVSVNIDKASKTASSVKFSDIKLSVHRDFPEGALNLAINGGSLVDECSILQYNAGDAASVTVATVVTPAPDEENGNGLFLINSSFYNLNGQMKMMDVAPYIKNGRTYVPVRYLAYVCGLSDSGIAWDATTQTVTLTKGDKVVKLVVGSTTLTAGDTTTTMDVAPELNKGRTMLPARYVAEAFGGTVTWNDATQAVGIQF